jgi:hypothetical protein
MRSATTAVLLCIYLLGAVANCVSRKEVATFPAAQIDSFALWRRQTEFAVRRVKTHYVPDSDQYKEAERRYIGAQAKVNVLIDRLMIDFSNGVDVASSEVFADTWEVAVSKTTAFKEYVDKLFRSAEATVSDGPSIDLRILKDATQYLWQDYKDGSPQHRNDIREAIRGLKWNAFDDL